MSYCSENNQEMTRMTKILRRKWIRTKHQVPTKVSIYWEHSVFLKYPYFEKTCPFNLHLIHTDDSNTLTAERVQGEPGEKTRGKHIMKVEHDNIRHNAQGTAGTNENLRDHADDHGILHHVGNFFGAIGRGVTNAASWMWEAIKSPFT